MKKAAIVTFSFVLLVAGLLASGCGSGGGATDSKGPSAVAKAFWTASLKGDADTSWDMLSANIKTGLKSKAKWAESVRNDPNASVKVEEAKIEGDSATVMVKILSSGKEVLTSEVELVKEDGGWKVESP